LPPYYRYALGYSLDELRHDGWVAPQQPVGGALDAFAYFQFDLVRWELLPSLFPTWLGMYVVVAFSSSLDVAAIQARGPFTMRTMRHVACHHT